MTLDRTLLPAIAAFAEVAREGSFTSAAHRLGISPSALSQSVRALEQRVGIRLLNRSTRSISLTHEGRRLLARVAPNLAGIADALDELDGARDLPTGDICITMPRVIARHYVEPHLKEFQRRYPKVGVELLVDEALHDIVRDGIDAGIRLRESVGEMMIAIAVTPPVSMAVVASPAYFAVNPIPSSPSDLINHDCIAFRRPTHGTIYRWEFTDPASGVDMEIQPRGRFVTNVDEVMIGAALQGVGIAMHVEFAVAAHIASGQLVRVLHAWCPPFDGFHIYVPSRENMPAKLRVFVDFLVEKRRDAKDVA